MEVRRYAFFPINPMMIITTLTTMAPPEICPTSRIIS
jgi:hypothetical protein